MASKQDTGKHRKNTNDMYYTKKDVAKQCIEIIKENIQDSETYQWVEPSAGNGAFILDGCVALDIEPKHKNIIKQDFLTYVPKFEKKILIYGNPPFGKQSSTAKKFIKHATSFADVVAFILPRSFVKPSMNNVFSNYFHCTHSKELEKDSFEVNETSYDVPCVFQIWVKKDTERNKELKVEPLGFSYVKHTDSYDLTIRRVGVKAGTAKEKSEKVSPQSHYFIKLTSVEELVEIVKKINAHTFPSNTVGPRSLSKHEINLVLNSFLN
jgi:hypothetical protein